MKATATSRRIGAGFRCWAERSCPGMRNATLSALAIRMMKLSPPLQYSCLWLTDVYAGRCHPNRSRPHRGNEPFSSVAQPITIRAATTACGAGFPVPLTIGQTAHRYVPGSRRCTRPSCCHSAGSASRGARVRPV